MPTGGIYQSRHLEQKVRGVLRRRTRFLPAGFSSTLIPTESDLSPGIRELVQDEVLEFGDAQLGAIDAFDIPLAEIQARENRYRVVMPRAGYPVKFAETLSDEVARGNGIQYNPRDVRATAVLRIIEEQFNKFSMVGASNMGITGLLNNAGVTPVNSSFDPFSAASTPDDIADWLLSLIGDTFASSNNVEYPNTMLVSSRLSNLLERRRMPDSGDTILSYIMRTQRERAAMNNGRGLKAIIGLVECGAAYLEANGVESAATNKDRIVLYPMDREVLERHVMKLGVASYPDDWAIGSANGETKIYPMYSFLSELMLNFPGAVSYIKHNKEV
jgi:hypothetical protein